MTSVLCTFFEYCNLRPKENREELQIEVAELLKARREARKSHPSRTALDPSTSSKMGQQVSQLLWLNMQNTFAYLLRRILIQSVSD